jgi:hypothetical protein
MITVRAIPARLIRALVAATLVARPKRTLLTLIASRGPVGKRSVTTRTRRVTVFAARRTILAFSRIRPPLALRLARKTAFGELLPRAPRNPRAALAAGRAVASAPGVVVFIIVAGHERSRFGCRYK